MVRAVMALIAHVSDFHLHPAPFPWQWPLRLKPALGWINAVRKPGAHDRASLDRTLDAIRRAAPDHVVVTGDLYETGLVREIAAAGEVLASLGDAAAVSWAPGNHDVYTTDVPARIAAGLAPWLAEPGRAAKDLREAFPRTTMLAGVRIVALSSGTPTWTFSAEGELGKAQLARLDAILARRPPASLDIVAVHHPPLPDGLNPLQRLRDSHALLDILFAHGVPLLLHGHLHRRLVRNVSRGDHILTLLGAPSASSTGHHDEPAGFNLIEVAADGAGFVLRDYAATPAIAASASA